MNGMAGYNSQGLPGKVVELNTLNNEYVRCQNHLLFTSGTRYFVFWVRRRGLGQGTILASSGATSSARSWWWLSFVNNAGNSTVNLEFGYQFVLSGSPTLVTLANPNTIYPQVVADSEPWSLICIGTSNTSQVHISVNAGAFETITATSAAGTSTAANTLFGGRPAASSTNRVIKEASSSWLNCQMDDFQVYSAQPTLDFLAQLFNSGKGRKPHRLPFYRTNCLSHVTADNLNAKDGRSVQQGWGIMANLYRDEYLRTGSVYLDGVNDYIRGVNGTGGFNLSRFRTSNTSTINLLVNFVNPASFEDAAQYLLLGRSANTYFVRWFMGESTATSGSELFTLGSHVNSSWTWYPSTQVLQGWHMLTYSAGNVYINGIAMASKGGDPVPTLAWASIGVLEVGNFSGGSFWEFEFRELSIWIGKSLTAQEIADLYTFYTNSTGLDDTTRKLRNNATFYNDATLVENWSGEIAGGEIVASKRPRTLSNTDHHNLILSGRVLTPTGNTNFFRRRGQNVI